MVLLVITDAVFILINRARFTSSDELGILIIIGVLLVIYLVSMFLPSVAFFILSLFISLFTRRSISDIRGDDAIVSNFNRGRFVYLLFADFMLLLIFLEAVSYLFA